jgi:hypothetical protein
MRVVNDEALSRGPVAKALHCLVLASLDPGHRYHLCIGSGRVDPHSQSARLWCSDLRKRQLSRGCESATGIPDWHLGCAALGIYRLALPESAAPFDPLPPPLRSLPVKPWPDQLSHLIATAHFMCSKLGEHSLHGLCPRHGASAGSLCGRQLRDAQCGCGDFTRHSCAWCRDS